MARMRRSMAQLGLDSHSMSFALGRGSPVKATLRQAQNLNVDVLVASKQRRGRMATSVLGTINSLLTRSRCDMLIVSGGVRDPRHPPAVAALWQQAPAAPIGNRQGPPYIARVFMDACAVAGRCIHGRPARIGPSGAGG